jgi:hypothetical protein
MNFENMNELFSIQGRNPHQVDLVIPRPLFDEIELELASLYPDTHVGLSQEDAAENRVSLLMWRERFRMLFMHLDDALRRERQRPQQARDNRLIPK